VLRGLCRRRAGRGGRPLRHRPRRLERHRRDGPGAAWQGGQSALLAARIEAAAAAGCEVVVTETGEPVDGLANGSYRNIARAGFEPVYVRANYLAATAAS